MALKLQHLGPHHYRNQAAEATSILETTTYDGESNRFNYASYVRIHQEQHVLLTNLRLEGAHEGIHETSKTRLFY